MFEKFDLLQMKKEIEEDEKIGSHAKVKMSQVEIREMVKKKKAALKANKTDA